MAGGVAQWTEGGVVRDMHTLFVNLHKNGTKYYKHF